MICPGCQADNPEGARFCEECGARLEVAFCRSCGVSVTPEAGHLPSPESYTPKHLAEKNLGARGKVERERRQVTVLFADLKGPMELLADRDPEDARKPLTPCWDAVHRYEGTVNQVMGDGIMALFGAPLAHEDHGRRAVLAAVGIQRALRERQPDLGPAPGVELAVRIGLNKGVI